MRPPPFTPWKIPGTHFYYRPSRPQVHSATGRIRSTKKSSDLIGKRTHNSPAYSIVPQPTTLPCAPANFEQGANMEKCNPLSMLLIQF
jgi:hypothetical protein